MCHKERKFAVMVSKEELAEQVFMLLERSEVDLKDAVTVLRWMVSDITYRIEHQKATDESISLADC